MEGSAFTHEEGEQIKSILTRRAHLFKLLKVGVYLTKYCNL